MSQKLKWGIIGWGNISKTTANSFEDANFCELYSIASKTKKNFPTSEEYKNISFLDNYTELLNNSLIDAIYIGTTNNLHKDNILQCAAAKKHMICEKPACLSSKDFQECIKEIKSKEVFFTEGIMYLHHPQILKAIDIIKQGEIGRIVKIKSHFGFKVGKRFFSIELKKIDRKSRLFNPELGAGVINDLGCYPVTATLLFANLEKAENKIIKSQHTLKRDKFGIDESGKAKLIFENGIISDLEISIREKLINTIEIIGNLGSLQILNPWVHLKKKKYNIIKN